jgi:hypothetical protein
LASTLCERSEDAPRGNSVLYHFVLSEGRGVGFSFC